MTLKLGTLLLTTALLLGAVAAAPLAAAELAEDVETPLDGTLDAAWQDSGAAEILGPDRPGPGCRPYCLATSEDGSTYLVTLLLGPDRPGKPCQPYCEQASAPMDNLVLTILGPDKPNPGCRPACLAEDPSGNVWSVVTVPPELAALETEGNALLDAAWTASGAAGILGPDRPGPTCRPMC
ncbi:MAG TPA: hypothetical protein VNZ52_07025 [Candidatus Thermoplasmatota archaeon]|nr:hypothetical protein [Candidatus Thermoplasmatota archaeon]